MRPLGYKLEDFAPIGNVTATALLVVARSDAPYKTVAELIAYAKFTKGGGKALAERSGFDGYLVKPADPKVLIALLK